MRLAYCRVEALQTVWRKEKSEGIVELGSGDYSYKMKANVVYSTPLSFGLVDILQTMFLIAPLKPYL